MTWQPVYSLLHFSHTYCVQICALLVPFTMVMTLGTMIVVGLSVPKRRIWQLSWLGMTLAMLMILHVVSWLVVGVIMAPTYILLFLAGVCLVINSMAICFPVLLQRVLLAIVHVLRTRAMVLVRS